MRKDKIKDKVEEGLRRVFDEAESVFPVKLSWADINTKEVSQAAKGEFIWTAFYISKKRFDEIINEITKGTRWSWRWPRRSQIDKNGGLVPDPEWDEYQAAYEAKAKELEDKKITRKEFNAWQNEMGKKYGMQRRNYDKEAIEFNIWNVSPSIDKCAFDALRFAFSQVLDGKPVEEAIVGVIPMVDDDEVQREYNVRAELITEFDNDEEFENTFLDKNAIRESLESTYEVKMKNLKSNVEMCKRLWDNIFSKK